MGRSRRCWVGGAISWTCQAAIGATLDATLTTDRHATEVIRSCTYHTRTLRHTRPLLTLEAAKISHRTVTARLDYCNSLLHGTSVRKLNRLQAAQNELARAVCCTPRPVSASELRRQLHWTPVHQKINYKLALLTYEYKIYRHSCIPGVSAGSKVTGRL